MKNFWKTIGLAVLIAGVISVPLAWATTLSLTKPTFTNGEVIQAADFTNDFADIVNWANGNIDGDNITDRSITYIDITTNSITESEIQDNSLDASLKDLGVTSGKLAADAVVDSTKIAAGAVGTTDVALNATQQVSEIEEGTWAAGTCTGGTATPTSNPGSNASLRVSTTAATTDERIIAKLWVSVTCTSNCGNGKGVLITCNYNSSEDSSYAAIWFPQSSQPYTNSYMNSYTAATGGAKDLDCYVWRSDSSSVSNYCARLVVQQVKR